MRNFDPIWFAPQRRLGGGWIAFKDSPSPPAAPDYVGAAQAQGVANVDAARAQGQMNNPNVTTPYGSQTVTWGQPSYSYMGHDFANQGELANYVKSIGGNDQTTALWLADPSKYGVVVKGGDQPNVTQTLAPAQQQLLDSQNRISQSLANVAQQGVGYVQDTLNTPFNFGALPAAPVNAGQTYQDAAFSRLQPNIDQSQKALDTQLSNQGIGIGSEAWQNAQRQQAQAVNDQRAAIATSSIGQDTAARQAALQEQEFARTEPLNMLNAVRSGAQVQNPQFQPYSGSNVQPAPIFAGTQAQGQANQNAYNAQVAGQNSQTAGLFGLGGAGLNAYATMFPLL